jgi:prepilin-type N-terminal cleavage/methylation domain-containing protein
VRSTGFSLVEVIVAMTLLSIGMLAVAASGVLTTRLLNDAQLRAYMVARASGVLDSIITYDLQGAGQLAGPRYRIEWSAGGREVTVHARGADSLDFELRARR